MLGEYRLLELKSETACTRVWVAEQTSIARRAIVLQRKHDSPQDKDSFLADMCAKAAVDYPIVGSVYEAVDEETDCYAALEFLPGKHLAACVAEGKRIGPAALITSLRRVAETFHQHATLQQATTPLRLADIFLDDHGITRVKNLVTAGHPDPVCAAEDIFLLGTHLPALLEENGAGASRTKLLLGWMRGEGLNVPLTWEQVRGYCLQIEQQLGESAAAPAAPLPRPRPLLLWGVPAVAAALLAATWFFAIAPRQAPEELTGPVVFPPPVAIPGTGSVEAFLISPHETTIAEYEEFLGALEILAPSDNNTLYDDPAQPAAKTNHVPDDWTALLAAAKDRGMWKNMRVAPDSPVVGVDWWDATAFANWQRGRLPSEEEWTAALRHGGTAPETIPAAPWQSFNPASADRTPSGIFGMAGSVTEWTREPVADPSNPLGAKKMVLMGGSYLKPGSNALSRDWVDERSLRRADLGFRILPKDTE